MPQFNAVYPISDDDPNALPVRDIEGAVAFFTSTLGFSVVSSDSTTAVVKRDGVRIGVIRKADHDPLRAGSCYFTVDDIDGLRRELAENGAMPGAIRIQQHDGKDFRVFFVRECDSLEVHEGYCFCFGHPV